MAEAGPTDGTPDDEAVVALLEALYAAQAAATVRLEALEARRQQVLATVGHELAALGAQLSGPLSEAIRQADALRREAVADVQLLGTGVRSGHLEAVVTPARATWDADALDAYAEFFPEILALRHEQAPSNSIRPLERDAEGLWGSPRGRSDGSGAFTVRHLPCTHPRAYAPWAAEEDAALADGHARGLPAAVTAQSAGRKVGDIRSRLDKLGLGRTQR